MTLVIKKCYCPHAFQKRDQNRELWKTEGRPWKTGMRVNYLKPVVIKVYAGTLTSDHKRIESTFTPKSC